jgi:hypothetical protein
LRPIVTISADGTRASGIRVPTEIFDMATGDNLYVVPPPSAPPAPVSLTLSPDGMKLITVSRAAGDRRIGMCVVWHLTTQQRVIEMEAPPCARQDIDNLDLKHARNAQEIGAQRGQQVFRQFGDVDEDVGRIDFHRDDVHVAARKHREDFVRNAYAVGKLDIDTHGRWCSFLGKAKDVEPARAPSTTTLPARLAGRPSPPGRLDRRARSVDGDAVHHA